MQDGVINLLKPPAMTSHDAVGFIRGVLSQRRVGHAGTLDPFAAGVLPVCVGRATRLVEYLMGLDKCYLARIKLGVSTDTHDITGRIESRQCQLTVQRKEVEEALAKLAQQTEQIPPRFSALRVQGKRSYERARQGEDFDLPARPVLIRCVRLVDYAAESGLVFMEVVCGKGTYIRSMARDLGQILGTGAVLTHLLRTFSGHFRLENAFTLEEVASGKEGVMLAPIEALAHLPSLGVTWAQRERIAHGVAPVLDMPSAKTGSLCLVDPDGALAAVAEHTAERGLRLQKVFT